MDPEPSIFELPSPALLQKMPQDWNQLIPRFPEFGEPEPARLTVEKTRACGPSVSRLVIGVDLAKEVDDDLPRKLGEWLRKYEAKQQSGV